MSCGFIFLFSYGSVEDLLYSFYGVGQGKYQFERGKRCRPECNSQESRARDRVVQYGLISIRFIAG